MKLSERDFQQQIIDYAHLKKWHVAHFRKVRVQRQDGTTYYETPVVADGAGFPDLCLCRGERLVFVEVKADNGRLSQEQKDWLRALATTRNEAHMWQPRDWPMIEAILR